MNARPAHPPFVVPALAGPANVVSCPGDRLKPGLQARAFTLVEVLIAMAILTVIIAAIYSTWRAIMSATQTTQAVAADVQRARVAKRCLEQSLNYATMHVANMRYYWFDAKNGSDAYLSFVTRLPESFPRSGRFSGLPLRRVSFAIENGKEGGRDLVLRQQPIQLDMDEDEQNFPLVLMKNVKTMNIEFLDERKRDWVDEWTSTNQIPRKVRVVITTAHPRNPFGDGDQYFILAAPASAAVQPGWQSAAGPGTPPPGGAPGAPGIPPIPVPPPPRR